MNKKMPIRLILIAILLIAAIVSVMMGLKSNETITQQENTIQAMITKICEDNNNQSTWLQIQGQPIQIRCEQQKE